MDRFSEKQEKIDQLRSEVVAHFPALWSKMIMEWNRPGTDDRVWLMYSANYLFRTNNIRWAIDPLSLNWRIKDAPKVDVARDLKHLSFVLLTHSHSDHLDLDLLAALRHMPITWVVPESILSQVIEQAGLLRGNIIVASDLDPIELNGVRILPFDGLHWETASDGNFKGVPAMGYLIECNGKRWLLPGDTRTYNASQLPVFDFVDVAFAHLWLGRGSALLDEPPLLEDFCRFFLDLNPRCLILTHLNEFGRNAADYWDDTHVRSVCAKFQDISMNIPIASLAMGSTFSI
jgi:hypothetical protein